MGMHLIASNATIKAIKPDDLRTRLSDGKGLYLRLFVKGGSHAWWFDYTFEGRRKTTHRVPAKLQPGISVRRGDWPR